MWPRIWSKGEKENTEFPKPDPIRPDPEKGWSGYEAGGWEQGPAHAGSPEPGNPDPDADHTSTEENYVLGYAIGENYPNDLPEKEIVSPPIDCTGQEKVFLKFWGYLNVGNDDHASISVSNDGIDWVQVWESPLTGTADIQWTPIVYDISSVAAGQGSVYIKFTMGSTNATGAYSGWNIDDLELASSTPVYPAEGTMGTEFTITGSGFGTRKGKVLIGKTSVTVLGWNDELIRCRLTKVITPGVYDVTIQPSGPKGTPPIIEKDGFSVKVAEIHSVEQGKGSAYDLVTIHGKFFGTTKGKVYLEYDDNATYKKKGCTVLSWTMDRTTGDSEVVFVVPPMLSDVCDVVVDPYDVLPEAEDVDGFTVKAPEISSVDPDSGSAGDKITISGNYFGSKKGGVHLGYESKGKYKKPSCFVISWDADEIVFVVPKLPVGTYDVIVTNSVGSDTLPGGFEIP